MAYLTTERQGGGEPPHKPEVTMLEQVLQQTVNKAKPILHSLYLHQAIRASRFGVGDETDRMQNDIAKMDIESALNATRENMIAALTDKTIPLGCQNPPAHESIEDATLRIDTLMEEQKLAANAAFETMDDNSKAISLKNGTSEPWQAAGASISAHR